LAHIKTEMALPEHSKIINQVARLILKPNGLERKGQSRTWLDDNGWYTTVIEFQPFKDRQGTCINVGVNFHWYRKDYLSFDIGNRESDFIDFENDEQFTQEVEILAHYALDKALIYRQVLNEFDIAKQTIKKHEFTSDDLWGNYHKGTICGLTGDLEGLIQHYDNLLAVDQDVSWVHELQARVMELKQISPDLDKFGQRIISIIHETRELKRLKKLEIEIK
jgi:hypothetical protein